MLSLGTKLAHLIRSHPQWVDQTCNNIGAAEPTIPLDAVAVRELIASETNAPHSEPVDNASCSSSIRAGILGAWQRAANDPDTEVPRWIEDGAPAGIRCEIKPCDIFPEYQGVEVELHTDLAQQLPGVCGGGPERKPCKAIQQPAHERG